MHYLFDNNIVKRAWLPIQKRVLLVALFIGVVLSYLIITHFYEKKQRELEFQVASFSMKYAKSILASKGPLTIKGDIMYFGNTIANGADHLVDTITTETGFGCSIFLEDMRIATNIKEKGYEIRAVGSKANHELVENVLEADKAYVGNIKTLGDNWLVNSQPLHDENGQVVGILSLFESEQKFLEQLTAFKIMLATVLAGLLGLLMYFFANINRKNKILEDKNKRMKKISDALKWNIKETDKSRAKYKSLFDNSFDLIQEVDEEGRYVYVNNAWKEALGYSDKDIKQLTVWNIIHPEYHEHCKNILLKVMEQKKISGVDVAFINSNGDAILLNGNIHAELNDNGSMNTRGVFRNDTRQKMMHARLKESERQYRLLVESVDDVIFRTDIHGNFTYVNEKTVEFTKYSIRHLLEMNYLDLVEESHLEDVRKYYNNMFKSKEGSSYYEFKICASDGTVKWIGQNLTTIFADGSDQVISGYMAVARDISQLKEHREQLKLAHDALDVKNREITSSISYAKMIQHSHLPKIEILKGHFPDSFIIYEPKDIVSGDFYWFGETKDQLVIAAGDCTGHGVPGAFMTMIGLNQLTNIVSDKNITEPSAILELLDTYIHDTSQNGSLEREIIDGMDIAICTYHKKSGVLKFAGARRPLFLVSSGKLLRFSPVKKSIGERLTDYPVKYSTQTIEYEKGDMIYLFSDGMNDQFGGSLSKKFSLKKLRELLIDSSKLPTEEQDKLMRNEFYDWKKDHEQTDDVLLMGIKM